MQRLLVSMFACVLVLLNLIVVTPAEAQSLAATPANLFNVRTERQIQIAALTPEQKQEIITKKKEMFKPSAEEIEEKISAKLKMKQEMAENKPTAEQIGEKIKAKMEMFKSKISGE